MGLREEILTAPDADTIVELLKQGEQYVYASPRTRNAWHNAANRRRIELGQAVEVKKVDKKAERKEKQTQKRHKKKHE